MKAELEPRKSPETSGSSNLKRNRMKTLNQLIGHFVAATHALLLTSALTANVSVAQDLTAPCGFQILASFEFSDQFGQPSGANPSAGLTRGADSTFYGTTELGGSSGLGTVFKLIPDGSGSYMYKVIHQFSSPGG